MIRMLCWTTTVAAVVVFVVTASVCVGAEESTPSMKAGFAETDITPEIDLCGCRLLRSLPEADHRSGLPS